jgi:acetaldehyde dehydrogenase
MSSVPSSVPISGVPGIGAAIIGSGNIGTDLMVKLLRGAGTLKPLAMVGIDPASDGLARAARLGLATTADGVDGLIKLPCFDEIRVVFDATSASAHVANAAALRPYGVRMVDLTPAALGPYVVPAVNLDQLRDAAEVNMVTCGGQATIPIVAAIASVVPVAYAEIVASIASRSAGPGTRANIDEFTETTARAIEAVGGARRGKAVIVLNPADPPLMMRDTVFCLVSLGEDSGVQPAHIAAAVERMVADVATYVPGYRLKQAVQIARVSDDVSTLADGVTHQISVLLEVEGAGHYLPAYAGNLDIMTSAAVRAGERMAAR